MRRATGRGLAAVLLVPILAACSTAEPGGDGPRLVVLVAVCTLSKDFLSPYRPGVPYTPQIGSLARDGIVFERHQTEAAQSGTAYASIFSGTHADRHGVYHHPTWLDDDAYLIAEAFTDAGWESWFWSGHQLASPELNYAQGVAPARRVPWPLGPGVRSLTRLDPDFEALLTRLRGDPSLRVFVQVTFTLTHGPYEVGRHADALAQFRRRYPARAPRRTAAELARAFALYDAHRLELQWNFPEVVARLGLADDDVALLADALELAYASGVVQLDNYFGLILDMLRSHGVLDDALIAFTADHGEVLYRENAPFKWTHGLQLAPEDLGVPLILRAPGRLPAGRYGAVTRSIDVFPTLAGLAGVPIPPGETVEGVDLSPALRREAPPPELVAWSHTTTLDPVRLRETRQWRLFDGFFPRADPELMWVSARAGDAVYKLRKLDATRWGVELFDLARDPGETENRYDPSNAAHREMEQALRDYKRRLVVGYDPARLTRHVTDDERIEKLRSLGYIE